MKFLSYHVWLNDDHPHDGHDSNISYFDGQTVRYIKTERLFQIKHHRLHSSMCDTITENLWGVTKESVDSIIHIASDRRTVENKVGYQNLIPHISCESDQGEIFLDHHYAHSLSVSLMADVDVSINIDGRGSLKWWSVYRNDKVVAYGYADPYSMGEGLASMRSHFGINGNALDAAGKLMGLQSYGKVNTKFLDTLREYSIDNITPIFDYETFVGNDNKTDWLKTVHDRCGEIVMELFARYAKPNERIGYSGGIAQNVVWNTQLREKYPNLVIMPYSSDEGLSLAGIEFLRKKFDLPRPDFANFPFSQFDIAPKSECSQLDRVAKALADGKIVAWYQGNGEIGPRALGNRSILMDPRIVDGKDKINQVKNRESFRPFGASILAEFAKEYFDIDYDNPYMLYVGKVQKDDLPAITHVDGTCRFQTVTDGQFRQLLEKFHDLTNCPVLLNTSLNNAGNPIAAFTKNALHEYKSKAIDMLVIGNEIYER